MTADQAALRYVEIEQAFADPASMRVLASLSDERRQALGRYWLDRASSELTTALAFEFVLADLTRENAPAPLLELAESVIADEHRHSDWCLRWARLLNADAPELAALGGTRPVSFDGASEHDNRLLRVVFTSCFCETVAVHVLRESQRRITLDSARGRGSLSELSA